MPLETEASLFCSPLDRAMVQNCSPGHFGHTRTRTAPRTRLFGALLLALRIGLGFAGLRLVATFGRFQCLALILALWHLILFFGRSQNPHRAASLLHRSNRRLGGAPDRKFNLALELAVAKEFHPALLAAHQPGLDHRGSVDRRLGVDQAGIDRSLNPADIDLVEFQSERRVAKSALWEATMQRHLTAFEAFDANACTRGLALTAAPASLAHARANTATNARALLARTRLVGDLVEFHRNTFLFRVADDPHQVLHLADHAASSLVIRQIAHAADFIEAKSNQRRALIVVPPLRAAHLLNLDGLLCLSHALFLSRPRLPRRRHVGATAA